MTGVQRQAADLLQQIKSTDFSLAKKKGMYLDIGKMEVLQMALEKQVPQEPHEVDSEYSCFTCPRCGARILCSDEMCSHEYCLACGQAIDWR